MSQKIMLEMKEIEKSITTGAILNPSQTEDGLDAVKKYLLGKSASNYDTPIRAIFYIKGKYDGLKLALKLVETQQK
jgi:hypothetical protein